MAPKYWAHTPSRKWHTAALGVCGMTVLACAEPALTDEARTSPAATDPAASGPAADLAGPEAVVSTATPISPVAALGRCPAGQQEALGDASSGYAVGLRVHVTRSDQSLSTLCGVLDEVNRIWWSQVGVCFDIEVVTHDEISGSQLDLWFERRAPFPNGVEANGVYVGAHEIFALDEPELASTRFGVMRPAARTAAHELGHALGLRHQDCGAACDELLMRSGTTGYAIRSDSPANVDEIAVVRANLRAAAGGPFVRALAAGEACLGARLAD